MNPYLKNLRERYEGHRVAIDEMQTRAVNEKRDLTDDEVRSIHTRADDAKKLYVEIETLTEIETHGRKVAELAAAVAGAGEGAAAGDEVRANLGAPAGVATRGGRAGAPPIMPNRAQVAELHRALTENRPGRVTVADREPIEHRAAAGTANTTAVTAGGVATAESSGQDGRVALEGAGLREPRRLAVAARLAGQNVALGSEVAFPIFDAAALSLFDVVPEGAAKGEYDAIRAGLVKPQKLAVWTDATLEALDQTTLETRLRQRHAAILAKAEDLLLITTAGVNAASTVTGTADAPYDETLLSAAARVLGGDVGAAPNLAVIAPDDVTRVFGGATGMSGETPENELRLHLHGMDIYVSSGITAGSAVVGAWRDAARLIVGMQPRVTVDPYTQLKDNIVTILSEEAVALAVDEPTGFVRVKFRP